MSASLDFDNFVGIFDCQLPQPVLESIAHAVDLVGIDASKYHCYNIGQRSQLLLTVCDQSAELIEIVILRSGNNLTCRVLTARKSLADNGKIRLQPVLAEQKHAAIPHTGLYFVNQRRCIRFGAQTVCLIKEFLGQADPSVVHHDYFVQKSRSFIVTGVIHTDFFGKSVDIVYIDGNHLVYACPLKCIIEIPPQATECLC